MATPAQKARAVLLYRHGLKNILNWSVSRELFFEKASTAEVERELRKGEAWLEEHLHPDPYLVPYQHGANVWERNPPFPEGIKLQMNFGREGYH